MSWLVILILIALGLIPSLSWLFFYVREDLRHPEPKQLLLFVFLGGILVTFAVLPVQLTINDYFKPLGIEQYSFYSFLVLGAIEEIFKFLIVFMLLHKRREFDEPLHVMIYMIASALGFAAAENVASVLNTAQGVFSIAVLEILALRFIGATLLHSLTSGLMGYYWSKAFVRGGQRFVLLHQRESTLIIKGLLMATILHAIFNYFIIISGPATMAVGFVVLVAFFLLNDFEKLKREDV